MFITFVSSPILQDYLCFNREQLNFPFLVKRAWKGALLLNISILARKKTTCLLLNTVSPICVLLRPWCWERLKVGGKGDDRRWDGWIASPIQWTWVWVNSRNWWCTGKPGMLWSMGSQRVRDDWATELSWTDIILKLTQTDYLIVLYTLQLEFFRFSFMFLLHLFIYDKCTLILLTAV